MLSGNYQQRRSAGVVVRRRTITARSRTSRRNPTRRRSYRSASRISSATRRPSRSRRATNTKPARIEASAARRSAARHELRHHEQQVAYTQQTVAAPDAREPVSDSRRSRARAHPQRLGRARHRRRRRVHRRRRSGRSGAHRNAHAADRESHLDREVTIRSRPGSSCRTGAAAASTIARISAARSISAAWTRTQRDVRTPSRSSKATATSRCSKSKWAPTSRMTGRSGPACRCPSACATTGRTTSTTTTTSRRARRSPTRRQQSSVRHSRAGSASSTIAAARSPSRTAAFRPGGLHRYVITDPVVSGSAASAVAVAPSRSSRAVSRPACRFRTRCNSVSSLDQQLRKGYAVGGVTRARAATDLFRSRDINAPPPPLYLDRPDPAYGAMRQSNPTAAKRRLAAGDVARTG